MLYAATHPVKKSNIATREEFHALLRFAENGCASTPRLITCARNRVSEGTDPLGMVGGYVRILIMTKLPGENLCNIFWGLSRTERDFVRQRFKSALR